VARKKEVEEFKAGAGHGKGNLCRTYGAGDFFATIPSPYGLG
jgi:hypothetical protein